MEKRSGTKRKINITKIVLVMFFLGAILLSRNTFAVTTGLDWENPNKNIGENLYKLTVDNVLNTKTLMQVVGCTGVVNKLSGAVSGLFSYNTKVLNMSNDRFATLTQKEIDKLGKDKYLEQACIRYKGSIEAAVSQIQNVTITQAISDGYKCDTIQKTTDYETQQLIRKQIDLNNSTEQREACFNGLAYTLAKNQLTSMTRETVNWINSGFNGNPLYVQNITALTQSIERNVIEKSIQQIDKNSSYPYGSDFSKSIVRSYNGGLLYSSANTLGSLVSDITAFVTDKDSYTSSSSTNNNNYSATYTPQNAIDNFNNNFSWGGWDAYLAMTQRDANNPLGFTMKASQYVADRIEQQKNETKDEVTQNNGFLSQKECEMWQVYTKDGPKKIKNGITSPSGNVTLTTDSDYEHSETKTSQYDQCIKWKVVTPGSIIKDKLSTYMNSPERQLELADDINSVLNTLFSTLIENLRSSGLYNLSKEKYSTDSNSNIISGYGTNTYRTDLSIGYDDASYSSSSSYGSSSPSFDLLRDLGNTYIHGEFTELGKWDAKNNSAKDMSGNYFHDENGDITGDISQLGTSSYKPSLNIGIGVRKYDPSTQTYTYTNPSYYLTTNTQGSTKLFNNGYSGWAVGDKAFWNGSEWQNWKKGESNPIDKRGIIQIQKDYAVAAREILKILPSVMPQLGELDYCIPGPNPNWKNNSLNNSINFIEYANSLNSIYKAGSLFKENKVNIEIAQKGDSAYDNYNGSINNANLMRGIESTFLWKILNSLGAIINDANSANLGERIAKWWSETWYGEDLDIDEQAVISELSNSINNQISSFYSKYQTSVFDKIYGTIRKEYNERENTSTLTKNNAYIPMIEDGYAMTKNILTESENIDEATQIYKDEITTAESNISRLNQIKSQVDVIIKNAQDRRTQRLLSKIIPIYYSTKTIDTATEEEKKNAIAKYKIDYADCFEEEYIDYIDYGDIVNNTTESGERCSDGIDNDLDGKIDSADTDCSSSNSNGTSSGNRGGR